MPGSELRVGIQLWRTGVCSQEVHGPPREEPTAPCQCVTHTVPLSPQNNWMGSLISILQAGSQGSLYPTCLCRVRSVGGGGPLLGCRGLPLQAPLGVPSHRIGGSQTEQCSLSPLWRTVAFVFLLKTGQLSGKRGRVKTGT